MNLRPVSFEYKQGYGDSGATIQLGFVAEEAVKIDPRLVVFDAQGLPSGFNYPTYTAVLTSAIQEMNLNLEGIAGTNVPIPGSEPDTFVSAFFKNLESVFTGWLADAGNGIGNIFASSITVKNQLCINTTCINESQLQQLLNNLNSNGGGTASVSQSSPTPSSTADVPVITLIGDSTINLNVGDTYTEQGATATENLNAVAVVITGSVDTTTAGTYTIDYNATDSAGNKAVEVTRTVIVASAVTPSPSTDSSSTDSSSDSTSSPQTTSTTPDASAPSSN